MKNLLETTRAEEIKDRLKQLSADSQPLWGTMNAAQMLAHCAGALRMSFGEIPPVRHFFTNILGFLIKPLVFKNDEPLRRNAPTTQALVMTGELDIETERAQLGALIDRFVKAAPADITSLPHSFFGKLTQAEWAILMYKHLDHHLRQFGV